MDYGTLKTLIAGYLHRDDLTATIPTFITLAQARMSHDLDIPMMETTTTLSVTADTEEVTLPTDLLAVRSVRIPYSGGVRELQHRSLAGNSQIYETAGGATGSPLYYARYGSTLELSPSPSSSETLTLIYKQRLGAFSDDTDTDDILTNYPNIYVYATMLEATPYLIDDARAATWKAYYDDEVIKLNAVADDQWWSGLPAQINPNLGVDTP